MDVMMVNRRAHGRACPTFSTLTFLKVLAPWGARRHGQKCRCVVRFRVSHIMSGGRGGSLPAAKPFHSRWSFQNTQDHPLRLGGTETYFWFGSGDPLPAPISKKVVQRHSTIRLARLERGRVGRYLRRLGGRPAEFHQRFPRPKSSHANTVAVGKPK